MSQEDLSGHKKNSINTDDASTLEDQNILENSLEFYRNWMENFYKPEEFRSNVKLWGSGILALSLWCLLGMLAWSHFEASRKFANEISSLKPQLEEDGTISLVHQQEIQLNEKANAMVDSTSNRLYTFLTPIVTAVTGYFFVSSATKPPIKQTDLGKPKG
ncbi:hypothetical protein [Acaryochloris marina]|uniref:Transmembrane protein n=1 Tax=Acaryochloris marina (strain MBIC 11017) TaxID=329726 RepID=A8ZLE0_ACAM1|nr:hypothetical protein [Acaryochloris marina]ABW31967.1 hypothetical protein AM1_B0248 [Acaryochloris marina MBIC11017]